MFWRWGFGGRRFKGGIQDKGLDNDQLPILCWGFLTVSSYSFLPPKPYGNYCGLYVRFIEASGVSRFSRSSGFRGRAGRAQRMQKNKCIGQGPCGWWRLHCLKVVSWDLLKKLAEDAKTDDACGQLSTQELPRIRDLSSTWFRL